MPGESSAQLSAVLGRAKAFARVLRLSLQREFDHLHSLYDWQRKLRLLKAVCWSVDRFLVGLSRGRSENALIIQNCEAWMSRINLAVDSAMDTLGSANTPDIHQRVDRYAAQSALSAIYKVLRDVNSVACDLESAQLDLGVSPQSESLSSLIKDVALPQAPGADVVTLIQETFADAELSLRSNDALVLCMSMRHTLTVYAFALTIDFARWSESKIYEQVCQLHRRAVELTNLQLELADHDPSYRALVMACLKANKFRLDRLTATLTPYLRPKDFANIALPDISVNEIVDVAVEEFATLTTSKVPRVVVIGDHSAWVSSIETQLQEDYQIENLSSKPCSVDLVILSLKQWRAEMSNSKASSDGNLQAARVVCIGGPDDVRPSNLPTSWHYSNESAGKIDPFFVQVYLTGRVSDEWCQKALANRRRSALGDCTGEWLFDSFLLPEFSRDPAGPAPQYKGLVTLDSIRDRVTDCRLSWTTEEADSAGETIPKLGSDFDKVLAAEVRQTAERTLRRFPSIRESGLNDEVIAEQFGEILEKLTA